MGDLRVSLIQADIFWEDKNKNLSYYGDLIEGLSGKADLVLLPEMFTTGFSMNCSHLAEYNNEETISRIKIWSDKYKLAVCGSFLARNPNDENCYNRGFFITPEGESYFYDKRHLFRLGSENKYFSPGEKQSIISYKGWNFKLIICYDLRFPVWIRNVENNYDVLLCSANWPEARATVWETLLKARAIENLSYVCGVNRIGKDAQGIEHKGRSMIIDPKGKVISSGENSKTSIVSFTLGKKQLDEFRQKFPVWKDADKFKIE